MSLTPTKRNVLADVNTEVRRIMKISDIKINPEKLLTKNIPKFITFPLGFQTWKLVLRKNRYSLDMRYSINKLFLKLTQLAQTG